MTEQQLEKIATVVHEAMRAWQRVNNQQVAPPWEETTWERESTIEAVRHALEDPTPGAQHTAWMKERLAQGWTYGPEKDTTRKTNPSLVPFEELSAVEIAKDHLIIQISQALADAV